MVALIRFGDDRDSLGCKKIAGETRIDDAAGKDSEARQPDQKPKWRLLYQIQAISKFKWLQYQMQATRLGDERVLVNLKKMAWLEK